MRPGAASPMLCLQLCWSKVSAGRPRSIARSAWRCSSGRRRRFVPKAAGGGAGRGGKGGGDGRGGGEIPGDPRLCVRRRAETGPRRRHLRLGMPEERDVPAASGESRPTAEAAPALPAWGAEARDERLARLLRKSRALPDSPGVYLMKDHKGVVLYVGKAGRLPG